MNSMTISGRNRFFSRNYAIERMATGFSYIYTSDFQRISLSAEHETSTRAILCQRMKGKQLNGICLDGAVNDFGPTCQFPF